MKCRIALVILGLLCLAPQCGEAPITLECVSERDCEDDNDCTLNPCDKSLDLNDPTQWFCAPPSTLADGSACDLSFGSGEKDGFCTSGVCGEDQCNASNAESVCDDDDKCSVDSCDELMNPAVCVNDVPAAMGNACDLNGNNDGVCDVAGVCRECLDDNDCVGNPVGAICELSLNQCVECLMNSDCIGNPKGTNCNPSTNACDMNCNDDVDCIGNPNGDICDVGSNACVECLSDEDCPGGTPLCNSNTCEALPSYNAVFSIDCAALGTIAVNDLQVTVQATPQGRVVQGVAVDIDFDVTEAFLNFALLQGFADSVCAPNPEEEVDIADTGSFDFETSLGGSGSASLGTNAQSLEITNPLAIPDIALGTGSFTPGASATTLSIALQSVAMTLTAPVGLCQPPLLAVPVNCPCEDLAMPPAMCELEAPSGSLDIPVETGP